MPGQRMPAAMVGIMLLQPRRAVVVEADEPRRAVDPYRRLGEEVARGQTRSHAGEDAVDTGLVERHPG